MPAMLRLQEEVTIITMSANKTPRAHIINLKTLCRTCPPVAPMQLEMPTIQASRIWLCSNPIIQAVILWIWALEAIHFTSLNKTEQKTNICQIWTFKIFPAPCQIIIISPTTKCVKTRRILKIHRDAIRTIITILILRNMGAVVEISLNQQVHLLVQETTLFLPLFILRAHWRPLRRLRLVEYPTEAMVAVLSTFNKRRMGLRERLRASPITITESAPSILIQEVLPLAAQNTTSTSSRIRILNR